MARRKPDLSGKVGMVSPFEYNWEEQFGSLEPSDGFVSLDVGKVYGLAVALHRAQDKLSRQHELLMDIRERLYQTTMSAPEDTLLQRLNKEIRDEQS